MSNVVRVGSINSPYPEGATALTNSSGNVANSAAVATLTVPAGKMGFLTGFMIAAGGVTVGALVNATITGLSGGTITLPYGAPVGATVQATPYVVTFPQPIPASAIGQNIVLTVPALGAGNTNAGVVAFGYYV